MSTKIKNAKIRVVNDPTVTEIYVSFKSNPDFKLSNGRFDIEFTPATTEETPTPSIPVASTSNSAASAEISKPEVATEGISSVNKG